MTDRYVAVAEPDPDAIRGLAGLMRESDATVLAEAVSLDALADDVLGQRSAASVLVGTDAAWREADTRQLAQFLQPDSRVKLVIIGDSRDNEIIRTCFWAGVHAYLRRSAEPETIRRTLDLVRNGHTVYPDWPMPEPQHILGGRCVSRARGKRPAVETDDFSAREQAILACLASGWTNQAIGDHLGVPDVRVKQDVQRLMNKLGVRNRTEAAVWAVHAFALTSWHTTAGHKVPISLEGGSLQSTEFGVDERRAYQRYSVQCSGVLRPRGHDEPVRVTVEDISCRGVRVQLSAADRACGRVRAGQSLKIALPGIGKVWARVVWSAGSQAGLIFDQMEVDPRELLQASQRWRGMATGPDDPEGDN